MNRDTCLLLVIQGTRRLRIAFGATCAFSGAISDGPRKYHGSSADLQLGKLHRLIENKGHGVFLTRSGEQPSFHSAHLGEAE